MRALRYVLLLTILGACSHQAKKVDCDKHLIAINPPTPVAKPITAAGKSSP
jgi:hypothetical protein